MKSEGPALRQLGMFVRFVTAILIVVLTGCGAADGPEPVTEVQSALVVSSLHNNCGGSAVAPFSADAGFSGGSAQTHANTIDLTGVVNPAPAAVYQTARSGAFTYTYSGFPAGLNEKIRLHFAETGVTSAGARKFNVKINGSQVLTNFDIFAAAGTKNKAVVKEFTMPATSAGSFAIQFITVTNASYVSGIEIVPTAPCANGSAGEAFANGISGCAGAVTYTNRASLCAAGYHVASAAEWASWGGGTAPAHNYWTDDNLDFALTGSNCAAVTMPLAIGVCPFGQPMRVCTSSGTDPEGNVCNVQNCGLDSSGPNLYFGGCAGNNSAGTLCVRTLCANGEAAQTFADGMVGCAAASTNGSAAAVCAPEYHLASAEEWTQFRGTSAPTHDYWTIDQINTYSGTSGACAAAPPVDPLNPATPTPGGQSMRVCTASGTDTEGNQCSITQCGLNSSSPNQYLGGGATTSAGALCMHGFTPACPTGCDALCQQTTTTCAPEPWPNGVIYYEIVDSAATAAFQAGAAHWTALTQNYIQFQPSTTRPDRAQIFCIRDSSGACNTGSGGGNCTLGYSGGLQACRLATGGPADHEVGHLIGLSHEHIRGDRDRYVQVMPNAFSCSSTQNWSDNWWKCGTSDAGSDFGVYDKTSTMQYASNAQYFIVDRSTPGATGSFGGPANANDGSSVLEMYGYQQNWSKFLSLSTDLGEHLPLNVKIPSPPATTSNVTIAGRPALTSQGGYGNVDGYVRGSDNHIYHTFSSGGTWAGYDDMGGSPWDTDPSATSWGSGSSIIAAAHSGVISWKQYAVPYWGAWQAVPNPSVAMAAGSSPTITSWGPGSLHIFIRTTANKLLFLPYTGTWGAWTATPAAPTGTVFAGNPAVTSQTVNSLDIFSMSTAGGIWHANLSNGVWSAWENVATGADASSSPSASSWGIGRLDVLFKASSGLMYWNRFMHSWQGAVPIGGLLTSSPASVSPHANRIDVLTIGRDGGLWRRTYQHSASDYDGDGRADLVYFGHTDNLWHIRKSASATAQSQGFGGTSDQFAPGDYDGDGKTDIALYRPWETNWYYIFANGLAPAPTTFGVAADRAAPGDYDGDGRTDNATFHPADGTWRVHYSRGSADSLSGPFGGSTDQPVPGDYDGDGRTDLAYYRPSDGNWHIRPSGGGADITMQFGGDPSDQPVPGDYDGDGRTDYAVFRASVGTWYVRPIRGGSDVVTPFGVSTDIVQPADYDGDGKTDVALFRPSANTWYAHPSGGGADIVTSFGVSGDIPLTFHLP